MNYDILLIIWIHYLADFLCQPRYLAEKKSTDSLMLLYHCCLYSIPFLYFGFKYCIINLIFHFITDWPTSRLVRHYWYKDKKFVSFGFIGLDQAIHLSTLIYTYEVFING